MKRSLKSLVMLAICVCVVLSLFTGCGATTHEVVEFENFSCSNIVRGDIFKPTTFYIVRNSFGEEFLGYKNPFIQIDNKVFTLGETTLGEIYEMFMGVTVEEQIRTARAEDDGLLNETPEEIEEAKKEEESKKPEKDESKEGTEEEKEECPYSFYLQFDSGDYRTYAPIYLISSELVNKETILIYKHGIPYVQLNISNFYGANLGINQESDLVITGVQILPPKHEVYTDKKDVLNKAAKRNVWLSGGFSFSGDNYEYLTLPKIFELWGLPEGGGYTGDSEYYTEADDEAFYYIAELYCIDPIYHGDIAYTSKTVIKYVINRDTQKITSLSIDMEHLTSYDTEDYTFTTERPANIYGQ